MRKSFPVMDIGGVGLNISLLTMTIQKHLTVLFGDIESSSELRERDSEAYFRQFSFLPPMIGLGDGRMIYISRMGADAIIDTARALRASSNTLRAALSENDMINLTSNTIGELLKPADEKDDEIKIPEDVRSFAHNLQKCVWEKYNLLDTERTHVFGAWLFSDNAISTLKIGPVKFSSRGEWIDRAVQSKILEKTQASRIKAEWSGKKRRSSNKKKKTSAEFSESDIRATIGLCPWVCEIEVKGHSVERSREKAILAARIAFAAIASFWEEPSKFISDVGLLFDSPSAGRRATVAYNKDRIIATSRENRHKCGIYLGDAALFSSSERLVVVGRALDTFLAVTPTSDKKNLEIILCRALMWFGEACREPLNFLAIVKFAAALDTLAKGKKARGICELVKNRLAIKDMKRKFLKDGTSMEVFVHEVYDTGRSRIVHGSRPSLVEDLEGLRRRAELLSVITLRACMHWLHGYSGPDDENAYRATRPVKI